MPGHCSFLYSLYVYIDKEGRHIADTTGKLKPGIMKEAGRMKKKWAAAGCILLVIVLVAVFWLASPRVFLKGINPMNVAEIQVFDGNTGESFSITDTESVKHIVETVQRVKMKRKGLSIGRMGYRFRLAFLDKDGIWLSRFILNSATVIREDPFFYEIMESEGEDLLCYGYIERIETKGEKKTFLADVTEEPDEGTPENTDSTAVLKAMVMVDGQIYVDTGEISTAERCGVMDGNIDSSVPADRKPVQDNQSNFGKDYGFQYGMEEDTIDVYMEGEWRVFRALKKQER